MRREKNGIFVHVSLDSFFNLATAGMLYKYVTSNVNRAREGGVGHSAAGDLIILVGRGTGLLTDLDLLRVGSPQEFLFNILGRFTCG